MQISFAAPKAAIAAGSWVVASAEGSVLSPAAKKADAASGGALSRALAVSRFTGKSGQMLELLAPAGMKASRILLTGLGKPEALDAKAVETLGAEIVAKLRALGETNAMIEIEAPGAKLKSGEIAAHLAFGARLRAYRFEKYRTKNLDEYEMKLAALTFAAKDPAAARKAYAGLEAVADGVFLARDLINEPPNILYPAEFAKRAKAALSKLGVKVEVLGEAEMKKQGFGALLGVGQGSARESQLLVMRWEHGKKGAAPAAFVGKGVCFDSGGLSLKPGGSMMGMKGDIDRKSVV